MPTPDHHHHHHHHHHNHHHNRQQHLDELYPTSSPASFLSTGGAASSGVNGGSINTNGPLITSQFRSPEVIGMFILSRRRAPLFVLIFTALTVLSYSFLPSSSTFLILRNYKTLSDVPYDDALDVEFHPGMVIPDEGDGEAELSDDEDDFPSDVVTGQSTAKTSRTTGKSSSSPRGVTATAQHQHRVDSSAGLTAPSLAAVKEGILSHSAGESSSVFSGIPPPDLPHNHPNAELLREIRALTTLRPRWPSVNETPIFTLRSYGPAFSSIVVSHALKVVYIPVFKVGTSSIMWCIAYLENLQEVLKYDDRPADERHVALHNMTSAAWANHTIWDKQEQDIAAVFNDPSYMKFGFVRNPYDRAVSAYIDRIVRANISSPDYQRQIHSLFGKDWMTRQQQQQQQKLVMAAMAARNETMTNATIASATAAMVLIRPTFSQFMFAVHDVITQPRMPTPYAFEDGDNRRDLHWTPQSELLHPDIIHLDFVGRFERMEADMEVILEWMYRHTSRRIPKDLKVRLQTTDPSLKATMLETLGEDSSLVDSIQEGYAMDFHRFQYSTTIPDVEGIPHQIE